MGGGTYRKNNWAEERKNAETVRLYIESNDLSELSLYPLQIQTTW